jgi:hypothetical protein
VWHSHIVRLIGFRIYLLMWKGSTCSVTIGIGFAWSAVPFVVSGLFEVLFVPALFPALCSIFDNRAMSLDRIAVTLIGSFRQSMNCSMLPWVEQRVELYNETKALVTYATRTCRGRRDCRYSRIGRCLFGPHSKGPVPSLLDHRFLQMPWPIARKACSKEQVPAVYRPLLRRWRPA